MFIIYGDKLLNTMHDISIRQMYYYLVISLCDQCISSLV